MAPKRASSGGSASSEPKRPHVEAEAGAAKGGSIADSSAAERACHAQLDRERPQIAILDFGSQYSHLIARAVREQNVYCELYSCLVEADVLAKKQVVGVILSGGPSSVYEDGAPHVSPGVWEMIESQKLPVLGICYGMQELAHHYGGKVAPGAKREFGAAEVTPATGAAADAAGADAMALMKGFVDPFTVWMSHGDKVVALPEGWKSLARTDNAEHVAIGDTTRKVWGLQFHPEVTHSPRGRELLRNFVVDACGAPTDWKMDDLAGELTREMSAFVGERAHVIGAVSGGVDSTVAAMMMHAAIGKRFHAILVDSGTLREGEAAEVVKRLRGVHGIDLHCVDASERFLSALEGVSDPEKKRKTIGGLFIDVFQEESKRISAELGEEDGSEAGVKFLLQGTLYPDVIESISYKGPSATIKTHHNVGGLPASMKLKLVEPLRELFKDEVRSLGMALGISEESVWRHPFPGPGLAIRVLGELSKERLDVLRQADVILLDEIRKAGVYRAIGQAFVVLLPVKSVGVMGDGRTYENCCAIRCVQTTDYMTADWYRMDYDLLAKVSNRIINEVRGINRVCYDISSKPPATIEWE